MKKLFSVILAAMLTAGALSGCGGNSGTSSGSSSGSTGSTGSTASTSSTSASGSAAAGDATGVSAPGEFPIVKEKVTYKLMAPQTTYITDLNTNDFIKWYEDKTNVKIEFDLVPDSALKEKVNLTLASNKLPDGFLYCSISTSDLIKYGEQGTFLSMNSLLDEQGFYSKKVFDENALLPESITAPDGNIYALPSINECYHCFYAGRAWINTEWLKKVGKEYPTTTDELYDVLKAFKEQDANGNGKADDEIPMLGSDKGWNTRPYDFLLNSFVYNDYGPRLALVDGKVTFTANTPEFKEGLTYIKKLIDEGLIDPVSLTQTGEQFAAIAGNPDSIDTGVVVGATWWSGLGTDDADPLKRSRQYVGLSPLKGPNGVRNVLTSRGGINVSHFIITSQCKDPAPLFRWAEGQYDDYITTMANNGIEGVDWEKPAEGVKGINGKQALYTKLKETSGADSQNFCIPNFGVTNNTIDYRAGAAVLDEEQAQWGVEPRLERETKEYFEPYASDQAVPTILMNAADSTERARLEVPISDYVLENIVAFLSGTRDLEKDWDFYVNEFKVLELDKFLSIIQTGYDAQYK